MLLQGGLGELSSFLGLLAINLLAPRYLGARGYGKYIAVLAPAMLALGLIDAPLAPRLLSVAKRETRRIYRIKLAGSAVGAGVIAVLASQRCEIVVAAVLVAGGYSVATTASHLSYRRGHPAASSYASVVVMTTLSGLIVVAPARGWGGVRVAVAQGSLVLVSSLVVLVVIRRYTEGDRSVRFTPGTHVLSLPAVVTTVWQWSLVLIVERFHGDLAAAVARVGTSVASSPSAVIPVSGALIFAATQRAEAPEQAARRTIIGVAAVASLVAVGAIALRTRVIDFIGLSYAPLTRFIPVLVVGGVGLAIVQGAWIYIVHERLVGALARRLLLACAAYTLTICACALVSWESALLALGGGYVLIGATVAYVMSRRPVSPGVGELTRG